MSKRFTDSNKWDKPWYRKLPTKYKLLWLYITDKCAPMGLWHVDLETASYFTGETYDLSEAKLALGKQIQEVTDGTKWFIRDFITFQYGSLNPANHFHRSILKSLAENGVNSLGCPTPQSWGLCGPQDKDKDKDRSKDVRDGVEGKEAIPYQQFLDTYNTHRGALPKAEKLSEVRKSKMRVRWHEQPSLEYWAAVTRKLASSELAQKWTSLDWIIENNNNHVKAMEGNYDNRTEPHGGLPEWKRAR